MTDNLSKLIEYRFQQARQTLVVADELLQKGHYRDAVNRGYYAMFYCGLGLLAAKNLGSSKHSGVLSLFSRHFVKTGQISIEAGRHLREAFELRQNCDYREFVEITKDQAEEVIQNARAFIAEAQNALEAME
ncbi:MAG: HEPN domain-containing protein [Phycisphaerae bacterium]|nr:HEPN domain-containing protein [Phycisphaerae bacterium]